MSNHYSDESENKEWLLLVGILGLIGMVKGVEYRQWLSESILRLRSKRESDDKCPECGSFYELDDSRTQGVCPNCHYSSDHLHSTRENLLGGSCQRRPRMNSKNPDLFCSHCTKNQEMRLKLLSHFDPPDDVSRQTCILLAASINIQVTKTSSRFLRRSFTLNLFRITSKN
jgi:hypothetical protein